MENKIYKKQPITKWCCIPSTEEIDVTNQYVKKGEANIGDARKIDDAVSYEELFEKLGGINELKRMYLEQCLK